MRRNIVTQKKLFNIEKKIIIMKMARGNKYFQDNYDRKYGIQYMDNLTRHAIKKFFRKFGE
jgi:hypothetical protein